MGLQLRQKPTMFVRATLSVALGLGLVVPSAANIMASGQAMALGSGVAKINFKNAPVSVEAGQISSQLHLQMQDADGKPIGAGKAKVGLTSTSPTGEFSANGKTGWKSTPSYNIDKNRKFYYRDVTAGSYTIWATVQGGAITGLMGTSQAVTVTPDVTAPVVAITTPTKSFIGSKVTVSGQMTEAIPSHYYFVLKNSSGKVIGGPSVVYGSTVQDWALDATTLSEGSYTLVLEARDKAGNKGSVSVKQQVITVDHTAPVAALTPLSGMTVGGMLDISGMITDNGGTGVYKYEILNEDKTATVLSGDIEKGAVAESIDVSALASGKYYVRLMTTDEAGNVGTSADELFVVDHTAPVVKMEVTSSHTPMASTPVVLKGTVDEAADLELYVDDVLVPEFAINMTAAGEWSYTLQDGLIKGTHTLKVVGTDSYGNVDETAAPTQELVASAYIPPGSGSTLSPSIAPQQLPQNPAIVSPAAIVRSVASQQPVSQVQNDSPKQNDMAVLGADTAKEPAVSSDTSSRPIVASSNGWTFFGIAWYWWLLIMTVVAGVGSWVVISMKRRTETA